MHYTDALLTMLKENDFDLYNNPIMFIGDDASLLQNILKELTTNILFYFLDNIHANAIGNKKITIVAYKYSYYMPHRLHQW